MSIRWFVVGVALCCSSVARAGSVADTSTYVPDLFIGASSTDSVSFKDPYMVATDSMNDIYVTDLGRVQKFDSAGNPLWGCSYPDLDLHSLGIALAGDGTFWLSDHLGRQLLHCREGGAIIALAQPDSSLHFGLVRPYALAFGPHGVLYLTDYRDEDPDSTGRIFTYDPARNRWSLFWAGEGHPLRGIAVSRDGRRVVVAEVGASRVVILDAAGHVIGATPVDLNTFHNPQGVALAPGGDFYVVEQSAMVSVQHYSSRGRFIDRFGYANGSGSNQFYHPVGLALDRSHHLVVADSGNNRVVRWRILVPHEACP